jgi:hypothetical protein
MNIYELFYLVLLYHAAINFLIFLISSSSNLKGITQFEDRSARLKARITDISEFGCLLAKVQDEYHNYYTFFNENSDIKKKMPVESHLFEDITQIWS